MRIAYIADDGRTFDDKDSCIEYEENLIISTMVMLDADEFRTDAYENAFYAIITNEKELEFANKVWAIDNNYRYQFCEYGVYYRNSVYDDFKPIAESVKELRKKANKLEYIAKKMAILRSNEVEGE